MSDENKIKLELDEDAILAIDFDEIELVSQVFFEESKEVLDNLDGFILKLEDQPDDKEQINILFRRVHTIKGAVGAVPGGQLLGSVAHEFEALLNRIKVEQRSVNKECIDLFLQSSRILKILAKNLREKRDLFPEELSEAIELITRYGGFEFSDEAPLSKKPKLRVVANTQALSSEDDGVWMSTKQMNEMLHLSGELLVLKNYFQMMSQTVDFRLEPELYERRQGDFTQNLNKICDQFQTQVQTIRKEKVEECFQGLPILIRQTATELNKSVQFSSQGFDSFIDKGLGKDLYDALVHMVRNSIDHGMEDQFERTVQGKPSVGTISIDVSEEQGIVHLIYKDDGKGLNKERILARAIKNALITAEDASILTDDEIYKFILQPGFSTKEKVTTMSGRGVGMDVVLTTVEKYGGKIRIETELGKGSSFMLDVPVPQHILVEQALLCRWKDFQIAVPLKSVAYISSCDNLQSTLVNRLRFCQFNELTVPFLNYQEIVQNEVLVTDDEVQKCSAVVMKTKRGNIALLVDKVDGQTDLVVKPFGSIVKSVKGFKGISVLADEKVTYVVEPEQLLALLAQAPKSEERAA